MKGALWLSVHIAKKIVINNIDDEDDPCLVIKETIGRVRIETMYSCPHCSKVLGIGD